MFPHERQTLLDPLLTELRTIPGVMEVHTDDWNSVAIDVFLALDTGRPAYEPSRFYKPMHFTSPLRNIKAAIKRLCKKHGLGFNFLDWPVMKYTYSYFQGQRETYKDGYDQTDIKI